MEKTWLSEIATVAAVLTAALPVVMDAIPKESKIYAVLGAILSIAVYVAGHNAKKIAAAKITSLEAVAKGPSQPPA